jgi:hypothetical protein
LVGKRVAMTVVQRAISMAALMAVMWAMSAMKWAEMPAASMVDATVDYSVVQKAVSWAV